MNKNIRWYSINDNLITQDNEIVDFEKACNIVDKYLKNQNYMDDNMNEIRGEEVLSKRVSFK